MNKNYSIRLFIFFALLINASSHYSYAQKSDSIPEKPRIVRVVNTMESRIEYSCRDSIYADLRNNKITLYGEAKLVTEGITMTADLIEMDTEKNEVYCTYTLDKEGNRVGIPKFEDGSESFTAATIRYNFDTEKGYIQELKTSQDELHLHMGTSKRHPNDHVHFINGKVTTCDLDHPHFHFHLSKAVLVPNERIATQRMNLWVKDVPTPIGLPFSVIPMRGGDEPETGGLLFPQIVPTSAFGMGLQDLGYYFPIKQSDEVQTTFYGSIYSQGTFELRNLTDYKKRYKFTGNTNIGYSSFRRPFPQDSIRSQKIVVQWNHQQEAKANPYWRFNSRVNFQSDNNGQNTLDPISDQFFQNSFNSDINLTRSFPTLPITMGLKTALRQNSASGNFDTDLPTFTMNVNRFFPFKGLRKSSIGGEKFYEKIAMTFNTEARNRALFSDELIQQRRYDLIEKQFQNGINSNARVIFAQPLFNQLLTSTFSMNYNMRVNFQQIRKNYDFVAEELVIDTLRQAGISQDMSANVDLSTNLYAYYRFAWDKDLKMRHVITPNISFRYTPNTSSFITGDAGPQGQEISYSPYERSLYREASGREMSVINYSVNNTFEIKRKAKRDTLEEFERIRIVDRFVISGNYDMLRDSMKLSPTRLAANVAPIPGVNIVTSADFSPYAWDEVTGTTKSTFAKDEGLGMGRFTSFSIQTGYTFAPRASQEKVRENQDEMNQFWEADLQHFMMHPYEIIDFEIPWKFTVSWNLYYNLNTNPQVYIQNRYRQTQNLSFNGDVSFTKRWKATLNANYDVVTNQLTQARISANRDMHCWVLGFFWTPVGGQKSFLVSFRATSSLFEAAKVELRKPPEFL